MSTSEAYAAVRSEYSSFSEYDAASAWLSDWHYGVPEGNAKCGCDFDPRRGDNYDLRCLAAFSIRSAHHDKLREPNA